MSAYQFTRPVQTQRSRVVRCEDGFGRKRVPDGTVQGIVEVSIDLERLARYLGERALLNKGRRSRALSGLLTAKVHSLVVTGQAGQP